MSLEESIKLEIVRQLDKEIISWEQWETVDK